MLGEWLGRFARGVGSFAVFMVAASTLLMGFALCAQPAGRIATDPAQPDSAGRSYDGVQAVVGPDVAIDVAPARPNAPEQPAAPVADLEEPAPSSIRRSSSAAYPAEILLDASAPPPPAPPDSKPAPRILTTKAGWHPGEQAKVKARRRPITFTPGIQLRSAIGGVSAFTLDDDGNRYDEGLQAGGRVRWNPSLSFGATEAVKIVGMIDVANGRWAPPLAADPVVQQILDRGQPPTPTFRLLDPRELYVQWTSRAGQLRVGQMAFGWGQGLVSNDGNNMDRFGDMQFGDDGDGSIVERILFATKPFSTLGGAGEDIVVALAADLVYRDPNASLVDGDLAGQGIFSMRWSPRATPLNWVGGYAAYRRQKSADDGDITADDDLLEVGVVDLAGQGVRWMTPKVALLGAFEGVLVAGRTTFLRGESDRHRVLQAAATTRGYVGNPDTWLAGFDAGWFSGDGDPYDAEVNNFQAAPGFTAGLVLFPSVLGWQSARSQLNATNPELTAVPPNGAQYIPSRGRVTNAVFAQPKARYAFAERFEIWGGPLFAASAIPLVDPYTTQLGGGTARNALGGSTERQYLGTELDLGLRARYDFDNLWMQAGLQGGVLFVGPSLRDDTGAGDRPIWGGAFRLEIRY